MRDASVVHPVTTRHSAAGGDGAVNRLKYEQVKQNDDGDRNTDGPEKNTAHNVLLVLCPLGNETEAMWFLHNVGSVRRTSAARKKHMMVLSGQAATCWTEHDCPGGI